MEPLEFKISISEWKDNNKGKDNNKDNNQSLLFVCSVITVFFNLNFAQISLFILFTHCLFILYIIIWLWLYSFIYNIALHVSNAPTSDY